MVRLFCFDHGGVAEWSKAAVLKTVVLKGTVGSNPTSSAISVNYRKQQFTETTPSLRYLAGLQPNLHPGDVNDVSTMLASKFNRV